MTGDTGKPTILLVEDDAAHAELIERALQDSKVDHQLHHSSDGDDALAYLEGLFNASMVYSSQFGRGGLLSHLLSHWNIAPLVRYQSGLPVNPASGKDNSLTGVGNDRPNVASTTTYTGAPHGLLYQYVNPNLYVPNPIGTYGNAGHNSLRGPGYFDVDVAVTREFKLYERLTFHARGEAFNALNHPNFGLPNTNISSSSFGQIRSARDPRILQASMKLIF